ncbi:MAG: tRNA dihydrouridine synthase DusB [Armatimonadetes bacterium]|nr:tRNA dihydrouridine synthase DusB [Armatimonadota bacterium]
MSKPLHTGFTVGGVAVDNRLVLAPMEDVSNLAFRLIAKEIGRPGLMFTEFVSAMAVHYGAAKSKHKMRVHPDEQPLAIQIFGGEPEIMAETAVIAEEMGADIIDINMGCWVPKVCRTGSGAALLKDPDLAELIVKSVVRAVKVPVTVKVRAGWDYSLFAAPDLARRFQDAGAQMLTLHARFAKQGFEGEADWDLIKRLRDVVTVPLIGNGDVKTPDDALKMLRETGCDGVMVGRAAISNPWALQKIHAAIMGHATPPDPTLDERIETALRHLRLLIEHEQLADPAQGELRACRALRGQIPLYIKGVQGAAVLRESLTKSSSYDEYENKLRGFAASLARPV